ncbi:hypothetical protein GCM10027614_61230 [Micromonospora vulcania]
MSARSLAGPAAALRACPEATQTNGGRRDGGQQHPGPFRGPDGPPCPGTAPAAGEGQWALGHREPLNPNERIKKDDDPLNVRARIETIYAHRGFASIDPQDLRGRFRWWGLYTQRKAGIDGGRTAVLEPHELEDEFFMLRVRIDGGQLSLAQLRVIADISREFARDTADITDRQNIQYHWIRVEDMPEIWRRLESVGLQTTEACGDCPRIVLGSPVAGVARDEVLDPTPAVDEIVARYVGDKQFSNLPRKFKTSISWLVDTPYQSNDISFLGVDHPEHGPGFDVWVGGGLSTNPMLAQRLGVWVPLAEVPDVWAGVVGIFRDYGYRRLRSRARLKFLVADWGVERFREVLEKDYLGRTLLDGPAPELPAKPVDHVGVHEQADGRHYVGAAPVVGRVSGGQLAQLADVVEAHGSDRVRLTPYQKLLVLDVPSERTESLVDALRGSAWRPGRRPGGAAPWRAPASSTASWPSSRRRPAARSWWPGWSSGCATSTRTSRSTSTAARTPAHAPRWPTSGSRGSWWSGRTAVRWRASRCTWAVGWAWPRGRPPDSGASCAV